MTTIRIYEYRYEVTCEEDDSEKCYCSHYDEAQEVFNELLNRGLCPHLQFNEHYDARRIKSTNLDVLRSIVKRNI